MTDTAKMIYADKQIATDILGKLIETSPDKLYELFKLPTGWQIARVNKLPAYMPPAKPLPVKLTSLEKAMEAYGEDEFPALPAKSPKSAKPLKAGDSLFVFTAQLIRETAAWYMVDAIPGTDYQWIAKTHVVSMTLNGLTAGQTFEFKVPFKVAKQKGWKHPATESDLPPASIAQAI